MNESKKKKFGSSDRYVITSYNPLNVVFTCRHDNKYDGMAGYKGVAIQKPSYYMHEKGGEK